MKDDFNSLRDVSGTMLITLYARARESLSRNPIIIDAKAVEMISIIKKEITGSKDPIHKKIIKDKYNHVLAATMSLRSRHFDNYTLEFLARYPQGTVINFGCGLDTRFERIDNHQLKWFDIDFPEVIKLRRRFMNENPRRTFIADSILNSDWYSTVKTGGPYLILAEGVFMYLKEDDVKILLASINRELPGSELVCEVTNRYWVEKMSSSYMQWKFKRQLGMAGGAVFTFGVPGARYFEEWSKEYHFLGEWTYFDDKEKKLGLLNILSRFELFRKVQYTVHYRIGN